MFARWKGRRTGRAIVAWPHRLAAFLGKFRAAGNHQALSAARALDRFARVLGARLQLRPARTLNLNHGTIRSSGRSFRSVARGCRERHALQYVRLVLRRCLPDTAVAVWLNPIVKQVDEFFEQV